MLRLVIKSQVMGGKNNMGVTRTGRHYPKASFAAWRKDACWQILSQLKGHETIKVPVSCTVNYVAGDKRRRDVPAILDALWHVLEIMKVVEDDTLIGGLGCNVNFKHGGYDPANPSVEILIGE